MNSNGWRKVTLNEISLGEKGSYGIAAAAVNYSKELLTYLRITDITDDGILSKESLKSVDDVNAGNYVLEPNDIVFARTGNSTGRSYFYDGSDGRLVYAGFLIKFSLDPSKVNPKYVRYYTLSDEYKNWVASFSTGSTRGNINAKTYGNMIISLPPRAQQDLLVSILLTLDEKIEVNNKINKTLEEMAQAIFKHWFVDFEFPNEDGEPYKSSGGEMVESELGLIPKGWEVGTLSDLGDIVGGGTPSTKREDFFTENGIPWVTPKDLSDNKNKYISKGAIDITEVGLRESSAKIVPKGTVLFSSRAPIGYIAIADCEMTTNQGFKSIVPKEEFGSEFVYQELRRKTEIIISRASGSTFKEISGSGLRAIETILPDVRVAKAFNHLIEPVTSRYRNNELEVEILKSIRDTLLPKLMSGEIRVPIDNTEEQ